MRRLPAIDRGGAPAVLLCALPLALLLPGRGGLGLAFGDPHWNGAHAPREGRKRGVVGVRPHRLALLTDRPVVPNGPGEMRSFAHGQRLALTELRVDLEEVLVICAGLEDGTGGGAEGDHNDAAGGTPFLPHEEVSCLGAFEVTCADPAGTVGRILVARGQVGEPGCGKT